MQITCRCWLLEHNSKCQWSRIVSFILELTEQYTSGDDVVLVGKMFKRVWHTSVFVLSEQSNSQCRSSRRFGLFLAAWAPRSASWPGSSPLPRGSTIIANSSRTSASDGERHVFVCLCAVWMWPFFCFPVRFLLTFDYLLGVGLFSAAGEEMIL